MRFSCLPLRTLACAALLVQALTAQVTLDEGDLDPAVAPPRWTRDEVEEQIVAALDWYGSVDEAVEDGDLADVVRAWSWHAFEVALNGLEPPVTPESRQRAELVARLLQEELDADAAPAFFARIAAWSEDDWREYRAARQEVRDVSQLPGPTERLAAYERVVDSFEKLGRIDQVADTLDEVAREQIELERISASIETRERAVALTRSLGDEKQLALRLGNLGIAWDQAQHPDEASACHAEALPIYRRIGDRFWIAQSLNNTASAWVAIGRGEEARELLEEARRIKVEYLESARERGDLEDTVRYSTSLVATLNELTLIHVDRGEYEVAIEFLEESIAAYPDGPELSWVYANAGSVYGSFGQHERAVEAYRRSMDIASRYGFPARKQIAALNLADQLSCVSRHEDALSMLDEARTFAWASFDSPWLSLSLAGIEGHILRLLGRFEEAEEVLTEAASEYLADALPIEAAALYTALASLHAVVDEHEEALRFIQFGVDALESAEHGGGYRHDQVKATLLDIRGTCLVGLGRREEALEEFRLAARLAPAFETGSLLMAALIEHDLGQVESAREYIDSLDPSDLTYDLKIIYARAAERTGQVPRARRALDEGLTELFELQGALRSPVSRQTFIDVWRRTLHASSVRCALSRSEELEPDPALALRFFELQRGTATVQEMVIRLQGYRPPEGQAADVQRERAIAHDIDRLTGELRTLAELGGFASARQRARLERAVEERAKEHRKLIDRIARVNAAYAQAVRPELLDLATLRSALPERTAFLAYALDREASLVLLVDEAGLTAYDLPPRSEIEGAVHEHLEATRRRGTSAEAALRSSRAAFDAVLGPVHAAGALDRYDQLLIAPQGALGRLPFATLALPASTNDDDSARYLVEAHATGFTQSASVWALQRRLSAERVREADAEVDVLVLADPRIDLDREETEPSLVATRDGYERLRWSRDEALGVVRALGLDELAESVGSERDQRTSVGGSEIWLGAEASKSALLADAAALRRFRYVHFAAHADANARSASVSRVLLSPSATDSGDLFLIDVMNLRLQAEVVTLSACETQLGVETGGEGVDSLARGFLFAGAENVIGSCWSVDDRATGELMPELYRQLSDGIAPAEALRRAQCAAIERARAGSSARVTAFDWGAWTVWGTCYAVPH